jgi:hypothetical protein
MEHLLLVLRDPLASGYSCPPAIDNARPRTAQSGHNFWELSTVISQRWTVWLIVGALGLPIVLCVLLGLANLLGAMQDAAGAVVVNRFALAIGVLWVIDLIALVILQAIQSAAAAQRHSNDDKD